jgi:YgiT-type zinc finger domain-containing protein
MEEARVDHWLRHGTEWVLFRNVPALKCDVCGEAIFSADTVDRLLGILRSQTVAPSGRIEAPVYDLDVLDGDAGKAGPILRTTRTR